MHTPKALIVARCHDVLKSSLEQLGYDCVFKEALSYEDAQKEIHLYEGLVTSNHLPVDKDLLDTADQLKWVGRLGSGMEIIDTSYAQARGIACFSSPEGNANAVAEQALGMLLALEANIIRSFLEIKNGLWRREENRGFEIEGKIAGIIGLGNNGHLFAKKLMAMGLKVLAYDPARNNYALPGVIGCDNLDSIYEQAEILSFHVPLNAETHHYFNKEMLSKMRQRFILLNLSRGPVVDQSALFKGLESGKIKGAALDVWEEEPFWKNPGSEISQQAQALLKMPNFIGTPHIGGYTHDALYKMSRVLGEKICRFAKP
ncbi:MAG TPA: NAD(P)-dependent oxidoreductase [Edaphocola sp.]|nr:NAD(P)-dependent oxidoreductase [Edaphocola sp.]